MNDQIQMYWELNLRPNAHTAGCRGLIPNSTAWGEDYGLPARIGLRNTWQCLPTVGYPAQLIVRNAVQKLAEWEFESPHDLRAWAGLPLCPPQPQPQHADRPLVSQAGFKTAWMRVDDYRLQPIVRFVAAANGQIVDVVFRPDAGYYLQIDGQQVSVSTFSHLVLCQMVADYPQGSAYADYRKA